MKSKWILILCVGLVAFSVAASGCSKCSSDKQANASKDSVAMKEKGAGIEKDVKLQPSARKLEKAPKRSSLTPFTQDFLASVLPPEGKNWKASKVTGHSAKNAEDPKSSFARRSYKGSQGKVTLTITDTMRDREHTKVARKRIGKLRRDKNFEMNKIRTGKLNGYEFYNKATKTSKSMFMVRGRLFIEAQATGVDSGSVALDLINQVDMATLLEKVGKPQRPGNLKRRGKHHPSAISPRFKGAPNQKGLNKMEKKNSLRKRNAKGVKPMKNRKPTQKNP